MPVIRESDTLPTDSQGRLAPYWERCEPLKLIYPSGSAQPEVWVYDDEEVGDIKIQFRPQGRYSGSRMAALTFSLDSLTQYAEDLATVVNNIAHSLPMAEGLD